MPHVPLSQRDVPADGYDGPYEGLPAWLDAAVRKYLRGALPMFPGDMLRTLGELRRAPRWFEDNDDDREVVIEYALTDEAFALDLIDHLLGTKKGMSGGSLAKELSASLLNAGSVWMVADDPGDKVRMLMRREPADTTDLLETVQATSPKVGEVLRKARSLLYGRARDATGAYAAVVEAIEAAMHAVVSPNDRSATLGKMNAVLRDAPAGRFTVVLGGKGTQPSEAAPIVLPLTTLIWTTQRRHGTDDRDPVTHTEAEAAYFAAVSVCGLFVGGSIVRQTLSS